MLDVLRIPPRHGRVFTTADEVAGVANLAVISHGFWERQLGADPNAVGRTSVIDGDPVEVIGVMPSDFVHPGRTLQADVDVWSPAGFRGAGVDSRGQLPGSRRVCRSIRCKPACPPMVRRPASSIPPTIRWPMDGSPAPFPCRSIWSGPLRHRCTYFSRVSVCCW